MLFWIRIFYKDIGNRHFVLYQNSSRGIFEYHDDWASSSSRYHHNHQCSWSAEQATWTRHTSSLPLLLLPSLPIHFALALQNLYSLWTDVFLFSFLLVCFFAVPLNSTSFCARITELAFTVKTCARALSSMWNPIRNSRQSIFWGRKQIVHRETFAAAESGCFDFRRFSTQVVPNRFTALVSAKLRINLAHRSRQMEKIDIDLLTLQIRETKALIWRSEQNCHMWRNKKKSDDEQTCVVKDVARHQALFQRTCVYVCESQVQFCSKIWTQVTFEESRELQNA